MVADWTIRGRCALGTTNKDTGVPASWPGCWGSRGEGLEPNPKGSLALAITTFHLEGRDKRAGLDTQDKRGDPVEGQDMTKSLSDVVADRLVLCKSRVGQTFFSGLFLSTLAACRPAIPTRSVDFCSRRPPSEAQKSTRRAKKGSPAPYFSVLKTQKPGRAIRHSSAIGRHRSL